jgi:flagellar protein FliS
MYRNAYLETEILSANPMQLVELLYRGAIDSVQKALAALERGDIAGRNGQITRVQAILTELTLSLDHGQGAGISRELAELYDYMQRRLNEANATQTAEPLLEVRKLLETLLEAWIAASYELSLGRAPGQVGVNQDPSQLGAVDFEGVRLNSLG